MKDLIIKFIILLFINVNCSSENVSNQLIIDSEMLTDNDKSDLLINVEYLADNIDISESSDKGVIDISDIWDVPDFIDLDFAEIYLDQDTEKTEIQDFQEENQSETIDIIEELFDFSENVSDVKNQGTIDEPFLVNEFPFVHYFNTLVSTSDLIDFYSCAQSTSEQGPEVIYEIQVSSKGTLKIEVLDGSSVDIDIHILKNLEMADKMASSCIERADTYLIIENIEPGTYYVVADSYSKNEEIYAGDYTLAVELDVYDKWQVRELTQGITWKKKIYSDLYGGKQTINVLVIDLKVEGVMIKPGWGEGNCKNTSLMAKNSGAVAAINGGFFDPPTCSALDMVKIDGKIYSYNHLTLEAQPTIGITEKKAALMQMIAVNKNWLAVKQALGGHPNLVTDGKKDIVPNKITDFYLLKHPRTAVGIDYYGKVLFVTVDGRTDAGKGFTMNQIAQYMIELGAIYAMNLDGGGSTTMYVKDQSINNIVNHPSDNQKADHWGERKVTDSLLVIKN